MDIVVLVKQVPDTESIIEIEGDGMSIKKQDIKWVMNPYDEIAVEEALQVREAQGGAVTVVSMGQQKTVETIRTALAMGADKGIHINDPAAEGSDALATAKILAAAVKEIPCDLIIAGHRAVDLQGNLSQAQRDRSSGLISVTSQPASARAIARTLRFQSGSGSSMPKPSRPCASSSS